MLANAHEPVFRPVDRFGARVDEVDFHPSWHWMLDKGVGLGLTGAPWTSHGTDAARASRCGIHRLESRSSRVTAARCR